MTGIVVVVPVVVVVVTPGTLRVVREVTGVTGTAPAAPKPQPAGTAALNASHGSGYVHPAIGVGAGVLSAALNQPLPDTIGFPAESVYVGVGSVLIAPVRVYEGNPASAGARTIEAGGQAYVVAICPAPAPPVIHDSYLPLNTGPVESPQVPRAVLGSLGIQPPRRPS
jgi:hypothetical protein